MVFFGVAFHDRAADRKEEPVSAETSRLEAGP
jgi:hypothetical protein